MGIQEIHIEFWSGNLFGNVNLEDWWRRRHYDES